MITYLYEHLFRQDSVSRSIIINVAKNTIIQLTNTDLIQGSVSIKDSLCSDTNLRFGKIEGAELSFTTTKTDFDYIGSLISVLCLPSGAQEPLNIPIGFIAIEEKYSSNRNRKFIRCIDLNYYLNKTDVTNWYNGLTFPMTLKQFRDSLFTNPIDVDGNHLPITQTNVSLVNDNMTVNRTIAPNQLSMAEVLQAICEVNGTFGHFYFATFAYITLEKFSTGLYPANDLYPEEPGTDTSGTDSAIDIGENGNYINANFEDYYVKPIDKLQIRTEENDIGVIVGTGDNTYIVEDNFLLYGKGTAELTTIANNLLGQISGISYVPCNIEIKGNPCLQVGDAIRMKTKNGYIVSYIMQRTLSGTQFLRDKYTATGDEYYTEENVGYNYDIKKLRGKSNVLSRTIEETRSELSSFETNVHDNYSTTTEMNSAILQSANSILSTVSNTYTTQSTFTTTIDDLQDQIDNRRTTWGGDVVPTLNNPPANSWTTDAEKDRHINDLYVVSSQGGQYAGFEYRFEKINGVYQWSLVPDTVATQALAQSQQALDGLDDLIDEIDVNYYTKTETDSQISQTATNITSSVSQTYEAKTDATSKLNTAKSYADGVGTNAVTTADGHTDTKLTSYYTKTETDSEISQSASDITLAVSQTYATISSLGAETDRATAQESSLSSRIDINANAITTKVSANGVISAINQTSESISINANRINLNGAVTANNNVTINQNGVITAKGGQFQNCVFLTDDGQTSSDQNINISNGQLVTYNSDGNQGISILKNQIDFYKYSGVENRWSGTISTNTVSSNPFLNILASSVDNNWGKVRIGYTPSPSSAGVSCITIGQYGVATGWNGDNVPVDMLRCKIKVLDIGAGEDTYATGYLAGEYNSNNEAVVILRTNLIYLVYAGTTLKQSITANEGQLIGTWYGTLRGSSDKRVKKDIKPLSEDVIDAIGQVELKEFVFSDEKYGRTDRKSIGAIAQDVLEQLGDSAENYGIVSEYKTVDGEQRYALNYNEFLVARNAYLEKRVDDLEKRIEQLEKLLKGD